MKKYNPLPKKNERTVSFSSPRNSRRGCLCKNRNEYSVKCCDGLLVEQGIGNIQAPASCIPVTLEYFVWFVSSSAEPRFLTPPAGNRQYVNYVDINNVSQSIEYWTQRVTAQPSMNFVVSATKPQASRTEMIFVQNEALAPYGTCFEVDVTLVSSTDSNGATQPSNLNPLPISMSYSDCCGVQQTLVFDTAPSTKRICVTEISEQLTINYLVPAVFPPVTSYWSPFRLNVVTSSNKPYIVCVP